MAALGTPGPTGEVSDGAALLRAGRFTTLRAQCQSNRRAHGGPSARAITCDVDPRVWQQDSNVEGQDDGQSQNM